MIKQFSQAIEKLTRVNKAGQSTKEKNAPQWVLDFDGVNMGLNTRGLVYHKVRPLLGKAEVYQLMLDRNDQMLETDSQIPPVTCMWGKKGEGTLTVVLNKDRGWDLVSNLRKSGILVTADSPKLMKRISRLFAGNALGHRDNNGFNYRIIEDEHKSPIPVTDGMAFVKSKFIALLLNKRDKNKKLIIPKQGSTYRFVMLTHEGQIKGTCVCIDDLQNDIVAARHNVKTEVRFKDKDRKWFCLEEVEKTKIGKMDLQTTINMDMVTEFSHYVKQELKRVRSYLVEPKKLRTWVEDEGVSSAWFFKNLEKAKERILAKKETKIPAFITCSPLDMALNNDVDIMMSPRMMQTALIKMVKGINIKKLSVRCPHSIRGYIIPDLSQFNLKTGEFEPNRTTVLKYNEVGVDSEYIPSGKEVLVVRQPNAPGEAIVWKSRAAAVSSTSIQISPLSEPSMAEYYPDMTVGEESWLELAGGADFDDAVMIYFHKSLVQRAKKRLEYLASLSLPKANLEAIIDDGAQLGDGKYDRLSILKFVLTRSAMGLGASINYMMGAVLVKRWDVYKNIVAAESPLELRQDEHMYLTSKKATMPDCWCPRDFYKQEEGVKLPVLQWANKYGQRFEYYKVKREKTKLCILLEELTELVTNLDAEIRDNVPLDQEARCNTHGFLSTLNKGANEYSEGKKAGDALTMAYYTSMGIECTYVGDWFDYFQKNPMSDFNLSFEQKKIRFGSMARHIMKNLSKNDKIASVCRLAVALLQKKARRYSNVLPKDIEESEQEYITHYNMFGRDTMLYTLNYNSKGEVCLENEYTAEPSIQSIWVGILRSLQ